MFYGMSASGDFDSEEFQNLSSKEQFEYLKKHSNPMSNQNPNMTTTELQECINNQALQLAGMRQMIFGLMLSLLKPNGPDPEVFIDMMLVDIIASKAQMPGFDKSSAFDAITEMGLKLMTDNRTEGAMITETLLMALKELMGEDGEQTGDIDNMLSNLSSGRGRQSARDPRKQSGGLQKSLKDIINDVMDDEMGGGDIRREMPKRGEQSAPAEKSWKNLMGDDANEF